MLVVVLAWVNAQARKDGAPLASSDIGGSIVSLVNKDGSLTSVATTTGAASTATIPAPTAAGSYQYVVENVDANGVVGDAGEAIAPIVIAPVAPPIDASPPVAPTNVTATLTDDATSA